MGCVLSPKKAQSANINFSARSCLNGGFFYALRKTMPSDNILGRAVSIEVLISLVAMLGTFYGGYSVLADDQVEQGEQLEAIAAKQDEFTTDIGHIKTDIEVIKTEGRHTKEAVDETKDELQVVRGLIEQMIRERRD